MDRYLEAAYSATPPSAPPASSGYPTNGNPQTATPASEPGEWWFHMVTEEIRNVIAVAGITPNHAAVNQLAAAIQQLIIAGGAVKTPVRVATTANIAALAGGAPNTLDGVALAANDRVLVKNQTTGSENGIYVVTTLGTGANGTWTRATDADGVGELTTGMLVAVSEGNTYPDTVWELATNGTITIGTTALTFQWAGGLIGLTQAQYDNSTKLATTAFVKRALGNLRGLTQLSNSTVALDDSHVGNVVIYGGSGTNTITLPSLANLNVGDGILFCGQDSIGNISCAGTDTIIIGETTGLTSFSLTGNDFCLIVKYSATAWHIVHGTPLLYGGARNRGVFGASLAASGYQKLPSGLIVQWGTYSGDLKAGVPQNVTLPITFPTQGLKVLSGGGSNGSQAQSSVGGQVLDSSTIQIWGWATATYNVNWLAIGN